MLSADFVLLEKRWLYRLHTPDDVFKLVLCYVTEEATKPWYMNLCSFVQVEREIGRLAIAI